MTVRLLPAGFGVLITRPGGQADGLCRLVEEHGGTAVCAPMFDIEPVTHGDAGARSLAGAETFDWLVFVSTNAVRCAFKLLGSNGLTGSRAKTAAIGKATAAALAAQGVAVDLKPKQQFNSEALLAEPAWADVAGQKFLIVRGAGGRELLADTLRARGAEVEYAEVYRRIACPVDLPGLVARWQAGLIGAATVTSGEALDRLAQLLAEAAGLELFRRTPMVVIGERLGKQARELGCAHVVAAEPGDAEIFNAVLRIGRAHNQTTFTTGIEHWSTRINN